MAVNINADTTTGLQLESDTSGNVNIQNNGTTVVAVTAPGVAVTGALSATGNISTPGGTITASSFSGDGSSLTGIAGGFSNMEVFTTSGTWTNPGNVNKVKVTVQGAGGGGGAFHNTYGLNGRSGAGGGSTIEIIPFPTATNVPVTIGSGGTAGSGTNGAAGGTGGSSSFGAYCSATGGGSSASFPDSAAFAVGGSGSGGNINFTGGPGGSGSGPSPSYRSSAPGGNSLLGSGGASASSSDNTTAVPAKSGTGYGGGGGGAGIGTSGGTGADGVVIVEY